MIQRTVTLHNTNRRRNKLPRINDRIFEDISSFIELRTLACYSQLSHKIGCHVEEGVWAGDHFLLVLEALADGMPFSIALGADDVLVSVAFEVDHVVILLKLVELDVDKDPDSVRNVG